MRTLVPSRFIPGTNLCLPLRPLQAILEEEKRKEYDVMIKKHEAMRIGCNPVLRITSAFP
jgi:hypothetical protein